MEQTPREQLKVVAERTVLVGVILPDSDVDSNDPLLELRSLAKTSGAEPVGELIQKRSKPRGKTYLGSGKVEELARLVEMLDATLIIFDNDLSPMQVRSLEEATECKVIDRSELILDIFANRATTRQAKLQVEIAQLEYTSPRLRAMWSHLGQVTGGAPMGVGTRGPGEQQLEIDRRLVQQRIKQLKRELGDILDRKGREVQDRNLDHYTIGLVGYTNAGKSTLFNVLTDGGAFSHEKLFATLSTRVEQWRLGGGNAALLSDTVGFIRDLPHHLVASFRSTLEETINAQLLMIVVDIADPRAAAQLATVERTLDRIGANTQPRLLILNKIDQLNDTDEIQRWREDYPDALAISAARGEGLEQLRETALSHMLGGVREVAITTPLTDSRSVDFLEKRAEVLSRAYDNGRVTMTVRVGRRHIEQLLARGATLTINGDDPHTAIQAHWEDEKPPPKKRIPPHERA